MGKQRGGLIRRRWQLRLLLLGVTLGLRFSILQALRTLRSAPGDQLPSLSARIKERDVAACRDMFAMEFVPFG